MGHAFRLTTVGAALLALGIATSALGQSTGGATTPEASRRGAGAPVAAPTNQAGAEKMASKDRKFIEEAARGGLAEVQLGQLAMEKAGSDAVKQFAKRMVDDHGKANGELQRLASGKGVKLPTEPDAKARREQERLGKLTGASFDLEYMKHMVSDHRDDVSDFRSAAKSAKDPDVKNFAASTLPTLEEHLKMARSTEASTHASAKRAPPGSASPSGRPGTGG
jgi:putative membrane protein